MDRKSAQGGHAGVALSDAVWIGRALPQTADQAWPPKALLRDHSKDPHLRTSLRSELPYEAVINYGLTYSGAWRVRNMSMSGAFVEMEEVRDLDEGAAVEFVLRYYAKGDPVEIRLPATAIRVQESGVALKFGHYDDETYTQLVNLLYTR